MGNKKIIIVSLSILVIVIVLVLLIFNSKKKIAPASLISLENKITVAEKEPSKILKVYNDDSGFSFKYPEDVQINKKDTTNDSTAYANLEISSSQTKGSISVKVLDTKFKSVDEWFLENKLTSAKEIKIGEISGKEANINNKITAAGLDQNVLFVIEVDSQNQKYWDDVYQTILSSFTVIPQQSLSSQSSDNSSGDAILEEETVE